MKPRHVPVINARYWAAILFASIFGTNLGDLYAHESGLGIVPGLLVLALLTGAAFSAERRDERTHQFWYWLVIIVIRTGATNIADYLAFRAHIPQALLVVVLAGLIAAFGWWCSRNARSGSDDGDRLPDTGAAYWMAMLSAGVFGTVLGDVCSHLVGEAGASLALLALFALALLIRRNDVLPAIASYWTTVAIARSAGTSIGDWLAESGLVGIGLPVATAVSGIGFVLLLIFLPGRRSARGSHEHG